MKLSSFSQLPNISNPEKETTKPKSGVGISKCAVSNLGRSVRSIFSESKTPKKRELIAGGDIRWKPVNAEAARLLCKSPEINHPPKTTKMIVDRDKTDSELDTEIAGKIINYSANGEKKLVEFANNAASARLLLDELASSLRHEVCDFRDEMPKAIKALRDWRMSVKSERDMAIEALQDIRKFFLGNDHEKEMARLESFIRTCERLRSLAQDGTLSKVADVMLKLA